MIIALSRKSANFEIQLSIYGTKNLIILKQIFLISTQTYLEFKKRAPMHKKYIRKKHNVIKNFV